MVNRIRLAWAFTRAFVSTNPVWLNTRDGMTLPVISGADDGAEAEGEEGGTATATAEPEAEGDGAEGDESEAEETPEQRAERLKRETRKQEERAKASHKAERAARKRADAAEAELAKLKDEGKTEQEKAIEQARKEVAAEAHEALKAERLKAAIATQAAKTFADVDDAQRLIDGGDDILFDDEGKVDADALKSALSDLLERKPHLAATAPGGSSDAGRGESGGKSLDDLTADDHLAQVRKRKD